MSDATQSAGTAGANQPYPMHAIQLADLRVTELNLRANLNVDRAHPAGAFELGTGHGPYDADKKQIQIKVSARLGHNEPGAPFSLFVELVGLFTVDETRFPIKHIEQWAQRNAPLVLYPYVREQAFGLAVRAGFPPLLLPLLEIPTFRLMPTKDGDFQLVTSRTDTAKQ